MRDRPVGFLTRWSRRKRTGQQVRRSKTAPVLPEERVRTEERGYAAAAPARPQRAPDPTFPVHRAVLMPCALMNPLPSFPSPSEIFKLTVIGSNAKNPASKVQ